MTTTRTTKEILAEIEAVQQARTSWHRLHSEGYNDGPSPYDSKAESLQVEFSEANKAEFAAEWTVEVLAARRAEWNDAIRVLAAKHGKTIPVSELVKLCKTLGYTGDQIKRAKQMHGVA